MDAPALLARVESLTNEAACKLFIQVAGITSDDASRHEPKLPPLLPRWKPQLPPLLVPSRACLVQLAKLRSVSTQAVYLASKRGFLYVAPFNGLHCWALTDKSRWICQLRRMDGHLFPRQDGPGFKALTVAGSRGAWPIGYKESSGFASIALVEGGGDFLAACHFIATERRGTQVAPVAMLGAANRIPNDCLELFHAKTVRIFAHVDKPNAAGSCPGLEAAARWQKQLTDAGAIVTCFDLSGLRKSDGSDVRDLNDLTSIHADDLNSDSQLSALMNF